MYNKCILNTQQARANRDAANRRSVGGSTLGVARQTGAIDSVTKDGKRQGKVQDTYLDAKDTESVLTGFL